MKTCLYIPLHAILADPAQAGASFAAAGRAAEAAGLDACSITDHPAATRAWRYSGGHEAFDPFAGLSFLAAATSRIRLLTHIVVLPYRNPFITAKGVATLDVLSGGRAIFGIGAGYLQPEYEALGIDYATRGAQMDEAIAVMKQAWSGEPVYYEGKGFSAADILPQPIPLQRPHPPIWCGGNSKAAIRRAARLCDGWAPFFVDPKSAKENATEELVTLDQLGGKCQLFRDELARAGRSGAFDICSSPPNLPQTCDAEARQIFIDQAGAMAEMGVNWMIVSFLGGTLAELLDGIAWFGAEVQPAFREL